MFGLVMVFVDLFIVWVVCGIGGWGWLWCYTVVFDFVVVFV